MKWETEFNFYEVSSIVSFEYRKRRCKCSFIGFTVNIHFLDDSTTIMMWEDADPPICVADFHIQRPIKDATRETVEELFGLAVEMTSLERGVYVHETHRP